MGPLYKGTASPFDDPYWLDFDPATPEPVAESTIRLRKLANQGTIRMPGLIANVRSLRQYGSNQGRLLSKATSLANDILALKDEGAENELLHHVTLKATRDIVDKPIMPYSFEFRSVYEKETLLLYWATKLMIIKLCMVLHTMNDNSTDGSDASRLFDAGKLDSEQERLVMSILMCWQDGFGLVNPLSMVWGALMGRTSFRNKPVEAVRSWVWTRYEDTLTGWPITYSMSDMDAESDEVAGGPLTHLMAKQDMRSASLSV
ncbi:hypothetical protein LTR53_003613 [Teratosphaeriaceae sp. CCFEE 6253]|nr:hypothetical protein LTR53_003613 [Teratosphaeriaceae sp. CCFEE 6253]